MRATSLMSTSVLSGLEGVSIMMTVTRPLRLGRGDGRAQACLSTPSAKPTASMP